MAKTAAVLSLIMILAFALRVLPIAAGAQGFAPQWWAIDETYMLVPALNVMSGDLNPHWFGWPAAPLIYQNAGIYYAYFSFGKATGTCSGLADFYAENEADQSGVRILGRLLTLLYAVLTIPVVFLLGKEVYDENIGLLAALFLAVCPMHAFYSHLMRPDVPQAFFIALMALGSLWLIKNRDALLYILTGTALGIAIATKYQSAAYVVAPIVAHLCGRGRHWHLAMSLAGAVCAFVLVSPFLLLDYTAAANDIAYELAIQRTNALPLQFPMNHIWYVAQFLDKGALAMVIGSFFLIGLLVALKSRRKKELLLLLTIAIVIAAIGFQNTRYDRFIIPLLPMACVFAANGANRLWLAGKRLKSPALRRTAGLCVLAAIIAGIGLLLLQTAIESQDFFKDDTRMVAAKWFEQNVPAWTWMAVEEGAALPEYKFESFRHVRSTYGEEYVTQNYLPSDMRNNGADFLRARGYQYAVFACDPSELCTEDEWFRNFADSAVSITAITPENHNAAGPAVYIFRLR